MSHSVNLIFFNFGANSALVEDLASYYKNSNKFEIESISDPNEANQFLAATQNGIFFFLIENKQDMQAAVSVLKYNKKLIKKGLIKPAGITSIRSDKIEQVLQKYGVKDILNPNTKAKTLSFKLDFWSKPILAQMDRMEKEQLLKEKRQAEKKNKKNNEKVNDEFVNCAALDLQSDFWIVKNKTDYKKILRRYLIRLMGPSSFIGSWVELPPQAGDRTPTWKYVLKDPSNTEYIMDEGTWYFSGSKPEFDWKINRWIFSSDLPHLYFYAADGTIYSRFKFENGQVLIAENSKYALGREQMILETCDTKYNIEGDATEEAGKESLEGETKTDHQNGTLSGDIKKKEKDGANLSGRHKNGAVDELGNPITGKSSTDEYGKDPLSGKTKGGVDHFGDNPLAGKAGTDEYGKDPLSGKSSTDAFGEDPFSGKADTDHFDNFGNKNNRGKKDKVAADGPYSGKTSTDEYGKDPLSGKTKGGADHFGDKPLAGKAGTDEYGKDPLGGKSSTDAFGEDPFSGKADTDHFDNFGNKNNRGKKDKAAADGPYSGKSSTDEYGKDPLSGKSSTDEYGKDPLGGKSSTDAFGEDPFSGKADTDHFDNFGNKNNRGKKDKPAADGPYSGKSSTDEYGKDPLGGKSSTDEYGKDPLAGKSSTDEYGKDPLGGKSSTDQYGKDPLSGKTSTDALGKDPLAGQADTDHFDNFGNKNNRGKKDKPATDGPYSGKTSTDEYGKKPLTGKIGANQLPGQKEKAAEDGAFAGENLLEQLGSPETNDPFADKAVNDPFAEAADPFGDVADAHAGPNAKVAVDDPSVAKAQADQTKAPAGQAKATVDANNKKAVDPSVAKAQADQSKASSKADGKAAANAKEKKAVANEAGDAFTVDAFDNADHPGKKNNASNLDDPLAKKNQQAADGPSKYDKKGPEEEGHDDLSKYGMLNGFGKKGKDNQENSEDAAGTTEEQKKKSKAAGDTSEQFSDDASAFEEVQPDLLARQQDALKARKSPAELAQKLDQQSKKDGAPGKADAVLDKDGAEVPYYKEKVEKQLAAKRKAEEEGTDFGDYIQDSKRKLAAKKAAQSAKLDDDDDNAKKERLAKKPVQTTSQQTNEMEKALDGGLTDGAFSDAKYDEDNNDGKPDLSTIIGEVQEHEVTEDDKPDLTAIIGGAPDVSLESGELKVVLKQKTKAGNDISFICDFEDFYEDELVVKAPKNSLPVDSEVKASVKLNYHGKEVKVSCVGKVEETESLNESLDTLVIAIDKINNEKYAEFLELYQERQISIAEFMKLAKGY